MALKDKETINLFNCRKNEDFLIYLLQTRNNTLKELAKKLGYSYQALSQKFKKNQFKEVDLTHFYKSLNLTDDELIIFINCD